MATKLWRKPFDAEKKATVPGKVKIERERCKGCGFCVEFCPRDVLKMTEELNNKGYTLAELADESKCLSCGLCEAICPEFAIHLNSTKENSPKDSKD